MLEQLFIPVVVLAPWITSQTTKKLWNLACPEVKELSIFKSLITLKGYALC
jgi:hypothetical protein